MQLTRDVFSVHHPADVAAGVVNAYKEDKERQKHALDTLEIAPCAIFWLQQAGGASVADAGYAQAGAGAMPTRVPLSGGLDADGNS